MSTQRITKVNENRFFLCEQICWTDFFMWTDFLMWTNLLNRFFFFMWTDFLLMFQIKPTKPIKPSQSSCAAIGQNIDPNRYASVLIITKPISIGLVTNLKKNRADRTAHTPNHNLTWACVGNMPIGPLHFLSFL